MVLQCPAVLCVVCPIAEYRDRDCTLTDRLTDTNPESPANHRDADPQRTDIVP